MTSAVFLPEVRTWASGTLCVRARVFLFQKVIRYENEGFVRR